MSGLLLTLYYSVDGKYQGTITTAKLTRDFIFQLMGRTFAVPHLRARMLPQTETADWGWANTTGTKSNTGLSSQFNNS